MKIEPSNIIDNIAVPYPGSMAEGIDAWLTAARAAGLAPEVVWRENGTAHNGLAVIDFPGVNDWRDHHTTRVWTRTYYRYSVSHDRREGTSRVLETRPSDGSGRWRYFTAWEGPTDQMPQEYAYRAEEQPYLVVAEWADDDHELYVLRTPDGQRRAGVVFGMGPEFAAWGLGALDLPEYELDHYNIHGSLGKAYGAPETADHLAVGVQRWEERENAELKAR